MTTVVDKVRKLLALSESPNENEAALAAEKAQELMLRYGVELAQVAAAEGGAAGVGVGHNEIKGKVDPWRRHLAGEVARSLGGDIVYWNHRRKWVGGITFWGQKDTVPGMVSLYQYLEAQLVTISALAAAEEGRTNGFDNAAHSMRWRRSFLMGAATRIGGRLAKRRREVVREGDNSKALVVIRDSVSEAIDSHYSQGELANVRTKASSDPAAYESGREAGDKVDLGDTRLPNEPRRIGDAAS